MKKYEFTGETKQIDSLCRTVTLRHIRAIAAFGFIRIGDLGGWIEKEIEHLEQENSS